MKMMREWRYSSTILLTWARDGSEWGQFHPCGFTPRGKQHQRQSGRYGEEKNFSPCWKLNPASSLCTAWSHYSLIHNPWEWSANSRQTNKHTTRSSFTSFCSSIFIQFSPIWLPFFGSYSNTRTDSIYYITTFGRWGYLKNSERKGLKLYHSLMWIQ
jgi:hypothetical protein